MSNEEFYNSIEQPHDDEGCYSKYYKQHQEQNERLEEIKYQELYN